MLEQITPLILTYNEAPNIERTLQKLTWAKTIVIIDSYSTDDTLNTLTFYPQVKVFQRSFDSFANQCNFGLRQISSEWVLSLDADYLLSDELLKELESLSPIAEVNSYSAGFKYCVAGLPLRGTLLPPRRVLYRRDKALYSDDGHAHRVEVQGGTAQLAGCIYHDDRKPLSRWLSSQERYTLLEAEKLLNTPIQELNWRDRLRRKKVIAPLIVPLYCLVLKGGLLDGWRGWFYAFQRLFSELLLAIYLIDMENLS